MFSGVGVAAGPLDEHVRFSAVDADSLPGEGLRLTTARDVPNPAVVKSFVSDAPAETSVQTMLLVAFSWWRVELNRVV